MSDKQPRTIRHHSRFAILLFASLSSLGCAGLFASMGFKPETYPRMQAANPIAGTPVRRETKAPYAVDLGCAVPADVTTLTATPDQICIKQVVARETDSSLPPVPLSASGGHYYWRFKADGADGPEFKHEQEGAPESLSQCGAHYFWHVTLAGCSPNAGLLKASTHELVFIRQEGDTKGPLYDVELGAWTFPAAPQPSPTPIAVEAPPAAPVDLPKLVQAGATFIDEMADYNAKDTYFVHVDALKDGLTWTSTMAPIDSHGHVTVKTNDAALRMAREISFISQGNVSPDGRKASATPPFLLGREMAKALRTGKTTKVSVYDVKAGQLKSVGTDVKTLLVDGAAAAVSTVRATDGNTTLWFADDPKWPVLVAAVFDGDNYIELKEVHTK